LSEQGEITRLLIRCREADTVILDRAWEALYPVLVRISRNILRDLEGSHGDGASLSGTDLLHQAYPRIANRLQTPEMPWSSRAELYAFARRAMLYELLDHRRRRARRDQLNREKIGGQSPGPPPDIEQLLALEQALERLARADPETYRVIDLRFDLDKTTDEIAAITAMSRYKVLARCKLGMAFLRRVLAEQI